MGIHPPYIIFKVFLCLMQSNFNKFKKILLDNPKRWFIIQGRTMITRSRPQSGKIADN